MRVIDSSKTRRARHLTIVRRHRLLIPIPRRLRHAHGAAKNVACRQEGASPRRISRISLRRHVIGSGASGLAAAVTAAWHGLKVIVVEKDPVFGGATAWSGGWMWVPGNPLAKRAGIKEEPQQPRTHLKNELGDRYDPSRVDAFLDNGPRMVAFFEEHTDLQFVDGNAIPDIHGKVPGAGT